VNFSLGLLVEMNDLFNGFGLIENENDIIHLRKDFKIYCHSINSVEFRTFNKFRTQGTRHIQTLFEGTPYHLDSSWRGSLHFSTS
jgi:hypothetical protein